MFQFYIMPVYLIKQGDTVAFVIVIFKLQMIAGMDTHDELQYSGSGMVGA